MKNITTMIICAVFNIIFMILGCQSFAQVVAPDLTVVNELKNGGAESGSTSWTIFYNDPSPIPLTVTTPNHSSNTKNFGKKYFNLNLNSSQQTDVNFRQVVPLNNAYKGMECALSYSYQSNIINGNTWSIDVLNQSGTEIAGRSLTSTPTGIWIQNRIEFPCGDNNNLTIQVTGSCGIICGGDGSLFENLQIDNIQLVARERIPSKFYYKSWILPTNPPGAYQFLFDNLAAFDQVTSGVIGLQTDFVTSKIMCADGSTGTSTDPFGVNTCTGNETLGIAVLIPRPGRYEVCTKFNYFTNNVADEGVFGLYENVSGNLGNERIYLKAAATVTAIAQAEVCETYNYQAVNVTYPTERQWILWGRRVGASAGQGIEVYMRTTSDYNSYMYWTVREL